MTRHQNETQKSTVEHLYCIGSFSAIYVSLSSKDMKKEDYIELYVTGIPLEMTEQGLTNLFLEKGGEVLRAVKLRPKNPEMKTCAG